MPDVRTRLAAAFVLAATSAVCTAARAADGTEIGSVSTTFRFLGANDKIVVDRYDDPKVDGVSCYLSHAATGGVKGSLGLATDPSRFSLACRATGPVTPKGNLPDNEIVFGQSTSFFFKELRVSRLFDHDKNALVYLAWSTKAMTTGGSPYNAVSVVAISR